MSEETNSEDIEYRTVEVLPNGDDLHAFEPVANETLADLLEFRQRETIYRQKWVSYEFRFWNIF